MAPPKSEFEREMAVLEGELKRLEAEWNMFLAGRLPRLPWETRKRVEQLVKKHDRAPTRNTADTFRFGTIQSLFAKFLELWDRQLQAKEMGRPVMGQQQQSVAAGQIAGAKERLAKRKEAGVNMRDPDQQADQVQALFEQLSEARRNAGERPIPFDRFQALVKAQVKQHGEGGKHDVAFRIGVKDGKVNLTVKAVKEGEDE